MAEDKKVDNLKLWNAVGTTDIRATKQVSFGRKFTAIDAYSQIMEATKQFGMYGAGWGIKDPVFTVLGEGLDALLMYQAIMFYKHGQKAGELPVEASIRMYFVNDRNPQGKIDEDCVKKVATDALTKGLSKLGFNADVFLGKFDDNKYVALMNEQADKRDTDAQKDKALKDIFLAASRDEVGKVWKENISLQKDPDFIEVVKEAGAKFLEPEPKPESEPEKRNLPELNDESTT